MTAVDILYLIQWLSGTVGIALLAFLTALIIYCEIRTRR